MNAFCGCTRVRVACVDLLSVFGCHSCHLSKAYLQDNARLYEERINLYSREMLILSRVREVKKKIIKKNTAEISKGLSVL